MEKHECSGEECRYCNRAGAYFDFDENGIFFICKKHLNLEASS